MNNEVTKNYRKYNYKLPLKKLILAQFGAAMLGIMTSMPTVSIANGGHALDLATSTLAVTFLLYLQYTAMWDIGAKDKIAIDGGRLRCDKLLGLKAALLANLPTYILCALSIIFKGIHLLTEVDAIGACATATYGAELLWNYMYHGYLVLIVPSDPNSAMFILYLAAFAALTIPSLLVSLIAYNRGLRGMRIIPEKKKN